MLTLHTSSSPPVGVMIGWGFVGLSVMRIPLTALFARTSDDTVDDVILIAGYGWFVVAGLQVLLLVLAAIGGRLSGGDMVDPIVAALGGYFLLKTKSRAVAGALLLYGVVTAVLSVAKILGLTGNGEPLIVVVVALWAGWRGWSGTRFWQTRACALPQWGHVRAGAALAFVLTVATLCLVLIATTGLHIPGGAVEFLIAAVLFLVPIAVLVRFARKRAFAANDPACPWPPKH